MTELTNQLKTLLNDRKIAQVSNLILNDETMKNIIENPWDIVPIITEHLNGKVEQSEPDFFLSCQSLLIQICEKLQPDDALLVLIKEIETIPQDSTLVILLVPLLKALLGVLSTKRINYLAWCLNAIQVYIDELPTPDNLNLEEEEKLMMDADPTVARISNLYQDVFSFYEVVHEKVMDVNSGDLKEILLRNYLQLLGKPLVFLDMHLENKPKSKARMVAERIVNKILEIDSNIYGFFKNDFIKNHEDVRIRILSLSTLFYLCLGEDYGCNRIPCVYDNVYIFQNSLRFIVKLFEYDNQFIIEKGLKLSQNLLLKTKNLTFNYHLLDSIYHCKFCQNLSTIIIYNPLEIYRKTGLEIFKNYLYRFDDRGRYLLISNIKRTINNTSLNAYITTQYKEMLVEQLDKKSIISEYFKDIKLRSLLRGFCRLEHGIETDLIKEADQIIAALNLLRYLALRDKENVTNFWGYCIKEIENNFLVPLQTALSISRAHYELKLKEITSENAHGDKLNNDSEVSVSIGGKNLPELTSGEKVKVINSSLTAFDVIESLLCRVNECLGL
ncbi:glomulin [Onthophagus taurus]|uniref:glomulin n=1 Tax=Onthophagus taurus TaxID=166361 RepID=UPI0039BEAF5F